ncbi:unnamed protein product, partial [Didymodactylos carnosus]
FNFRYASKWMHGNRSYRMLTKAFGLRLIIVVSGEASKFDLLRFTLNIGSVIGILGLATVIYDAAAVYFGQPGDMLK